MRWVRSNTRFASWLALFAFALQLTLSFGHLHLDGFPIPSIAGLVGAGADGGEI